LTSVAVYDPGGWSDNFAGVYADVTRANILLGDAKFWNKQKTPNLTNKKIKDDIKAIHSKFSFDYTLVETNNQGHMVISDLRGSPYHIPIIPITTSGKLKTAGFHRNKGKGNSFDKNKTVPWLQKFIEEGIIKYPKRLTPGLKEMKTEIDNYGMNKHGRYEALTGSDDSISCLVILTAWAKKKMLKNMVTGLVFGGGGNTVIKTEAEKIADKMRKRFPNHPNIRINIQEAGRQTW